MNALALEILVSVGFVYHQLFYYLPKHIRDRLNRMKQCLGLCFGVFGFSNGLHRKIYQNQ